ncbi:MAG: hypothetical protein J6A69_06560 [Clostridia bacterium]|nr:hypothetical protein [Clostridia bacterium]
MNINTNYSVVAKKNSFEVNDTNASEMFFDFGVSTIINDREDEILSFDKKDNTFIWTAFDGVFEKIYTLECDENYLLYKVNLTGKGKLGQVKYFNNTTFNTSGYFSPAVLSGGDVATYKDMLTVKDKREEYFIPPPQCYIFDMEGNENLIAVGLVAKEKEYNFSEFSYIPCGNSCSFGTDYGLYTEIDGCFELPHILIEIGKDRYHLLENNAKFHFEKGYVKQQKHHYEKWWSGNILCGWGDQWAIGAEIAGSQKASWDDEAVKENADKAPVMSTFDLAIGAATQKNYEKIISDAENKNIPFSTVIIDCKWHKQFGTMEVDKDKWPDMRQFIDTQHKKGRRVLLWYNFWSVEGLGEDECITLNGKPLYVDPTNPKYISHIEKTMEYLLSDKEGCCNADGFKVDFVTIPSEENLEIYEKGVFGIELVKRNISLMYNMAKKAKKDALITSQHVHPYFDECMDMMRIGDYWCKSNRPLYNLNTRTAILKATLPNLLIDIDAAGGSKKRDALLYFRRGAEIGTLSLYGTRLYDAFFTDDDWKEVAEIFTKNQKKAGLL